MLWAQQDARPLVEFTLSPLFEEHGIPLAVMGVLVVFSALVLIVVFITLLPRVLARVSPEESEQPAALPTTVEEGLSEELVVVIAAAVAATIDKPHRVVKIRGLTPAELGWSLEGRTQHHQSHRLRSRNR
jgi:sodium pump decarboxylase gamma subunit